jgi:DHA1 family multidrug resistance protein-like MFS transporter
VRRELSSELPAGATADGSRSAGQTQDWRVLLVIFCITSAVEGLGVNQIFAFAPAYLTAMGVADADRLRFIGIFSALIFVVGAPLVPLWGVWADKYSRKVVIVRSALVEAVVFACVALSREPWQLAGSMLLVGFQLGNTGVMLAAIRDATPRHRLGTAIALLGASGPIGMAIGPVLGGRIVDGLHQTLPVVFWVSSALSVGTALLVTFGSKEVRPTVIPQGRLVSLAFGAIRGVLTDPAIRRIFLIFGVAFVGIQMCRPYLPVLVEAVNGRVGLASAIGFVTGTAALVGALVSPAGGWLGDRIGFRPVLIGDLLIGGVAVAALPALGSVGALALGVLVFGACYAVVATMVFGLLATEVPAERRSATLNLVYLPLYAGGIVGPILGAIVVGVGIWAPFATAAMVFLLGGIGVAVLAVRAARPAGQP